MIAPGSHIFSIVLVVSVGGLVAAATTLTKIIVQISVYPQHIVVTMVMEITCAYSWWFHRNNYLLIYISG
jgi:hypothetical protein